MQIIDLVGNSTAAQELTTGNNPLYLTMFVIGMLVLFGMFIIYMIYISKQKKKELKVVKQSMEVHKPIQEDKEWIEVKPENNIILDQKPKELTGAVEPKSFVSLKKIKSWIDLKTKPQRCFLLEMTHFNGSIGHYITPESTKKFKIGQNTYIVDTSCSMRNITTKLPMLRYHEGFCLPYKLNIDIEEMHNKAAMESPKTQMSYYPDVLTGVVKAEYVKGVIAGGEVAPMLKKIFVVGLITLIACGGMLILLLTSSDLIKGVI